MGTSSNPFFSFIIQITGAIIVWVFKGFKGKLSDEMAVPYESNIKTWRNIIITCFLLFIVYLIVKSISENKEEKKEIYKIEYRRIEY